MLRFKYITYKAIIAPSFVILAKRFSNLFLPPLFERFQGPSNHKLNQQNQPV